MVVDIFLFLVATSTAFYCWCGYLVYRFKTIQRKPAVAPGGTSLLVPVCGIDHGAAENWISLCRQDHPEFEVLFGVKDRDDPAVPILQEIIREIEAGRIRTRARRVQLHFTTRILGANHQISNLRHLLSMARYEQVVFADSDIRVSPDYLKRVTAPLSEPSVGVVTCGYVDFHPRAIGPALAALGRGIDFIPGVLVARAFDRGLRFALGPTIATRKSVIRDIGGLRTVNNRIGSDFHIGRMAAGAGYRVELSDYILNNDCSRDTIRDVFLRELRWARTIRMNRGAQYYGQVLIHGTVFSIPLLCLAGLHSWGAILVPAVFAARFAQAWLAVRSLSIPNLIRWLWLLPLRDLMDFAVWVGGSLGSMVYWRGRRLRIYVRGTIMEKGDGFGMAPQAVAASSRGDEERLRHHARPRE